MNKQVFDAFSTDGEAFEKAIKNVFFNNLIVGGYKYREASDHQDHKEGTDFFIQNGEERIRVDVMVGTRDKVHTKTISSNGKPFQINLGQIEDNCFMKKVGNVYFQIRYGNSRKMFKNPVIIVGFDFTRKIREDVHYDRKVMSKVEEQMQRIISAVITINKQLVRAV